MSRLAPVLAIFSLSLSLWGAAFYGGRYLEQGLVRRELDRSPFGKLISTLREEVESNPSDTVKRIKLAESYVSEGYRLKNGQLVMRGLEQYKATLDLSPDHPEALLGLARVSLQNGVLDRAAEFFLRFLALKPEDLDARNDLVIALAQLNRLEEALTEHGKIVNQDPSFFPAKLSLALIYRIRGETEAAVATLNLAAAAAPSEEMRVQINATVAQMRNETAPNREVSPAGAVTGYFKDHQIIGPKISRLEWVSENQLSIYLNDFPIEQMPAGMRELFQTRAQEKLGQIAAGISVELKDEVTSKSLLVLNLGPLS